MQGDDIADIWDRGRRIETGQSYDSVKPDDQDQLKDRRRNEDDARLISCSCRRARTISSISSVELMIEELDLEVSQVAAIVVDAQTILDLQLKALYSDPRRELGRRAALSLVVCSGPFLLELQEEWKGGFGGEDDEDDWGLDSDEEGSSSDEEELESEEVESAESLDLLAFPQERGGGGSLLGDLIVSYDAALSLSARDGVSIGSGLHVLLVRGLSSLLGAAAAPPMPSSVLDHPLLSFPATASAARSPPRPVPAQLPDTTGDSDDRGSEEEEEEEGWEEGWEEEDGVEGPVWGGDWREQDLWR